MRNIERAGLADVLRELRQPLLGICLGMQLLFERSSEHEGAEGLGILPGEVTVLNGPRLPHIGWNRVTFERPSQLTEGFDEAAAFYHVHSFACRPADPADVVGSGEYGERFASVVERGNVMATQFHPEKSSRDGLRLLRNFARLAAVAVA
jgi:glutamine amidotransferase